VLGRAVAPVQQLGRVDADQHAVALTNARPVLALEPDRCPEAHTGPETQHHLHGRHPALALVRPA
jgi:hypothetical protein